MDIEQTLAFIAEQQVKNEADISRINATLERQAESIGALVQWARMQSDRDDAMVQTVGEFEKRLLQTIAQSEKQMRLAMAESEKRLRRTMAESGKRWSHAQEHLAGALEDLARSQAVTDKRLRDFIAHVAPYIVRAYGRKSREGGPSMPKSE